jgi:hypothetical protein
MRFSLLRVALVLWSLAKKTGFPDKEKSPICYSGQQNLFGHLSSPISEPTARKGHEAQLKPLLVEQDEDDLPEESLLENTESIFVGFPVPHWGHFSPVPSSPTFCRASNLLLHFPHRYS